MPISRAELPEEFFDITSNQLLVQPEPQYPYAQLMMAFLAGGIDLNPPDMLGRASVQIGGQGAPYTNPEQDRLILATSPIPGAIFANPMDKQFEGAPGHTKRFNRPRYTNTTYTQAAREIGVNQTISVVPTTAGSDQVPLTVKRYGGPYDLANTRVAPFGLDNFDASMGVHNLANFIGAHMKRDFHRTLDSFWVTLFDTAASTIRAIGMTDDNTATAKGQFPLTYEQISRTSRAMDDAFLPTLPDGRRVMVVTPTGKKQLKDDPQYARYSEFHKEMNPLFQGYFGATPEFHFFQSSTLTVTANTGSINIHKGHAIAPGVGLAGIGKKTRVAAASDDNYGETAKVIWLSYMALGLADNRFVYNVNYTEDAV